ncbi:unnamed protein product [Heligmosomoides polygyrus]|uniref:GCV_T domain-containing protein n=1 Tax=Heligmosomoides polygyrus TaxID=6339 RepID=A0A183G5E0_HELPZ|nr:unnamed protein product [Heligmosomoides polygyrus]
MTGRRIFMFPAGELDSWLENSFGYGKIGEQFVVDASAFLGLTAIVAEDGDQMAAIVNTLGLEDLNSEHFRFV